jgi:HprK-related kinase A
MTLRLSDLPPAQSQALLAGREGLRLQMGPFTANVRTRLDDVAASIYRLYGPYTLAESESFVDFSVSIQRPRGLRRLWQPQVTFALDGLDPFNPLPGDQGFPLLEWGLNWCVYSMCHQYLILHAAVLERHGKALILPAPSGSGKSTLCAALLFHGWRLLSDELTLICPKTGQLIPNPRPVSLKNESIGVIQQLVPQVRFGSRIEETTKGVVAHFQAPAHAVAQAHLPAQPGWVVLPRFSAGAATVLSPLERSQALLHLAENAFNYDIYGGEGFDMLAQLVDRSQCFRFEYSQLSEAVALFDRIADPNTHSLKP